MLSFIGLGLWDEKDITLKGLEEARKCDKLYAEFYTSKMGVSIEKIEELIGKKIEVLSREEVENGEALLNEAERSHVCLLTAGDPMAATTHVDLRIRAIERGIKTKVIHGVSIISASASLLGLQIYKFGKVVSIARPSENYFPLSPYDAIKDNMKMNLHSLLLLDTTDSYMTANDAMEILLEMERRKGENILGEDTLIAVVARVSADDAMARAGYIRDMIKEDFGETPHSIIIPGKLHIMEAKALVKIANAPEEILEKI
jgi:diphthine synthase